MTAPSPAADMLTWPNPAAPEFPDIFQPGDVLVFNRNGTFNWLIRIKTWSRFSHVEVAIPQIGPGLMAASRNGDGCGLYPFDPRGLALILRPTVPFDDQAAMRWYWGNAHGQGYDWLGLLAFFYAQRVGRDNARQFCSEFATRFLRAGGVPLFDGHDADTISPRDFTITPHLSVIWRSPDEWRRFLEGNS